ARLTLANARGAHEAGAALVPRAEVVAFLRAPAAAGARTGEGGEVQGVRVRDCLDPARREQEVRARVVVNATGPWSDALRLLADPGAPRRLRPTKGVHLMVRRERLGNRHAIIFRSPVDGRVMFVLPWGEHAYVGTTDTDYDGLPGDVRATPEDLAYLLASANGVFPGARLTEADVLSTWAGIRPLLAPRRGASEGLTAGATSREHEIWLSRGGLLNIAGGKLTTYRVMAEQTVDAAARLLKTRHGVESGHSPTADLPLPGAPSEPWPEFQARLTREAEAAGLDAAVGAHLARAYGEDAEALLAEVRRDPALGARIVEGHPYVWAEVPHAVRSEMALTLEDVLVRRLHLFYEAADGGLSVAGEVAARMAAEEGLGWSADETARQVARYRRAVEENREAVASTATTGGTGGIT
ncbi:MAG TPA: glycerol-3-phosphate dehydrogenase/oxidase, partial [Longimicrobiaceae bacterium]|nr:glycerol-3-phosphate dehydrogenase/oxidase [Longimicrobiaceae bacterium]